MKLLEVLRKSPPKPPLSKAGTAHIFVYFLVACQLLVQTALWAGDDHDHDSPPGKGPGAEKGGSAVTKPGGSHKGPRPQGGGGGAGPGPGSVGAEDTCPVSAQRLADFANGEGYDYANMVTYLTSPACAASSRQIAQAAVASGVVFNNAPPFRLDNFAKTLPRNELESSRRLELQLSRTMPGLLRQNPLSSTELLPLLGQMSLLSQAAGRSALATLIQQELILGEQTLSVQDKRGKELVATDVARTLVRLGAAESVMASELADNVEELAVMSQADSLGRMFRALAAAASVEASLVPTFNLSAGALNRGVQRSGKLFNPNDRSQMIVALFASIKSAMLGSGALEPGAVELNEGLGSLLSNTALTSSALRKLWKDAMTILATSNTQTAIADAMALSLTPQILFLSAGDMDLMMRAARNYPQLAGSVQSNFLTGWNRMWKDLQTSRIRVKTFNRMKEKYFEPMVAAILEFDPYVIDPIWLKTVVSRGMVGDEDIEKKFPRFVLAYIDRRDKATKQASQDAGAEPVLSSMAENMAVVWTLSSVHVPVLMRWVKKYEQ